MNQSDSAQPGSLTQRASDVHNFAVAALTVGSGLGAHFADEHAPWIASAGVLSMAYLNHRTYGSALQQVSSDLTQVSGELTQLRSQINEINRQMEEQRRKTQSGLATMATISHEIRSPLSAVIALGDLLHQAHLPADQRHMVQDLIDAGRMVMNVVNDSLDYARVEAGLAPVQNKIFSLHSLIARAQRQAEIMASDKPGVRIEAFPCSVNWVEGDEPHLQQVLTNLCTNAVKFTESGLVRISADTHPHPSKPHTLELTIRVADSGPGMDAAQQAKLFQAYGTLSAGHEHALRGTGLGLYLSRRLVESMGGSIGVHTEWGKGSEFWVTVPLAEVQLAPSVSPPAPRTTDSVSAPKQPLEGLTVGIVDDARINREVTRRIVDAHGGRCVLLDSGDMLIACASEAALGVDLLLLDIEMPGIGGIEAAQQLRALAPYRELPIIAVSAVATEDISDALQRQVFNGFLPKPFHAHTLVQKVLAHAGPSARVRS